MSWKGGYWNWEGELDDLLNLSFTSQQIILKWRTGAATIMEHETSCSLGLNGSHLSPNLSVNTENGVLALAWLRFGSWSPNPLFLSAKYVVLEGAIKGRDVSGYKMHLPTFKAARKNRKCIQKSHCQNFAYAAERRLKWATDLISSLSSSTWFALYSNGSQELILSALWNQ